MKVFKFGGASVKDASGVRNLTEILKRYKDQHLVIVLSAMGKTTNALENILDRFYQDQDYLKHLQALKHFHIEVVKDLFKKPEHVLSVIEELFMDIECRLERETEANYDYLYDQLIPLGELLSTKIVHFYLRNEDLENRWVDARNFIITRPVHREARPEWDITIPLIKRKIVPWVKEGLVLTQGFIGSTKDNITTTLGREGSDFTASILAYAMDAEEVTVWKDVPGVLNADPSLFEDTIKFDELSYGEAIEMSYYGARVLHPKTIKPLQNKNIPLRVRSFLDPESPGTLIHKGASSVLSVPVIIYKANQVLISVSSLDYSFIAEDNLSRIFEAMAYNRMKSNVMQNSALNFSFCTDYMHSKTEGFIAMLENEFKIKYQSGMELLTIRPYHPDKAEQLLHNKSVKLEQRNSNTVQYVIHSASTDLH